MSKINYLHINLKLRIHGDTVMSTLFKVDISSVHLYRAYVKVCAVPLTPITLSSNIVSKHYCKCKQAY